MRHMKNYFGIHYRQPTTFHCRTRISSKDPCCNLDDDFQGFWTFFEWQISSRSFPWSCVIKHSHNIEQCRYVRTAVHQATSWRYLFCRTEGDIRTKMYSSMCCWLYMSPSNRRRSLYWEAVLPLFPNTNKWNSNSSCKHRSFHKQFFFRKRIY